MKTILFYLLWWPLIILFVWNVLITNMFGAPSMVWWAAWPIGIGIELFLQWCKAIGGGNYNE